MSNEASGGLASVKAGNGDEDQRVGNFFRSLHVSSPTVSVSKPCISPATTTVELSEHTRDSGYGSATNTPDSKDTAIPLRKTGQVPFIRELGLYVSNKSMDTGTKRRFLEVQLEIERMLLDFMRKLKSVPGRYKPIAIRPMMLGKMQADPEAKPYMVVICSENIKRKVQDFLDESLVKSLCEPGDDEVPSFQALVIGHALRLRASTSDITVQCSAVNGFYDGTKTFCGMPVRLCDELGHSRNATFGGMVKVTFNDGEYQLYGLTAGHVVKDHQVIPVDERLSTWNGNDLVDLDLGKGPLEASEGQIRTTSRTMSDDIDHNSPEVWCFSNEHNLGKILNTDGEKTHVDEKQGQMKPYLDWALFELNAYRPNQLAFNGRDNSRGDLRLPVSTTNLGKDQIDVSMLCASQGVKHGVLSTTPARVLLDPGDGFTDAYTVSLEGSEISDGDSGSWVIDELRLEVYGHVVADDFFGDVYAIPMGDILADIQRFFDARSVNLPSGLDIISMAAVQQPSLFARLEPRDRPKIQAEAGLLEGVPQLSNTRMEPFLLAEGDANFVFEPANTFDWLPTDSLYGAALVPSSEEAISYTGEMILAPYTNPVHACASTNFSGTSPSATHDSGYSSLARPSGDLSQEKEQPE